jgi:hypothetical protein
MSQRSQGFGTRYDKFTPNNIAKEVAKAPGMGHWNGAMKKIFCVKCQKDKPRDGHKKRGQMTVCGDCA